MKRKFMTTAAFVSLLLCAATIAWWIRSGNCMTQLTLQHSGTSTYKLLGCGGKMMFSRSVRDGQGGGGGTVAWAAVPYDPSGNTPGSPKLLWTSFSFTNQPIKEAPGSESTLILPAYVPVAVFGVLPVMWVMMTLKGKKKKPAH